ncbi:MAG: multicopper oxidase domain-containing protein [Bacteroidota bacterium]
MKTKFTLITLFSLLLMCIGTLDTQAQKKDQFINEVPVPYTIEGVNQDWRLAIMITEHNFDPNGALDTTVNQKSGLLDVFDLSTDLPAFGYNFPDSIGESGAMTYLGPTFVLPRTNDWIDFPITNLIDTLTTVHWHALNLPAEADGGPHQRIKKDSTWHSIFPVIDEVQTAWYHSHLMDFTTDQVTRGMAGMIIIQDPNNDPLYAQLPHEYGVNDLLLALQAKNFIFESNDTVGNVVNHGKATAIKAGVKPGPGSFGMVNGVVGGVQRVPQSMVKLRLLNGASNKIMNIGLTKELLYEKTDGDVEYETMYMIATGGGYLDYPRPTKNNLLSLGDRREFVVDFGQYDNGDTLFLVHYQNKLPADATYGKNWYSSALMAFVVDNSINPVSPTTSLPATLKPLGPVPGPLDTTRTKVLTGNAPGGGGGGPWLIDGTPMIMNVINDTVLVNTKERWNIDNQTMHSHPWHIHKVQFQVVEYDGLLGFPDGKGGYRDTSGVWTWPNLPDELVGWKDVQLVRAGAKLSYEARFDSFPSPYDMEDLFTHGFMYHCHILSHEDTSMMHQFVVVDSLVTLVNDKEAKPDITLTLFPNPASNSINFTGDFLDAGVLRFYDINGKLLDIREMQSLPGANVPVDHLPRGKILVEYRSGNVRFIKKLLLQ